MISNRIIIVRSQRHQCPQIHDKVSGLDELRLPGTALEKKEDKVLEAVLYSFR